MNSTKKKWKNYTDNSFFLFFFSFFSFIFVFLIFPHFLQSLIHSDRLQALEAGSAEARASAILSGLQFTKQMFELPTSALSGGWRMRVALARALYLRPVSKMQKAKESGASRIWKATVDWHFYSSSLFQTCFVVIVAYLLCSKTTQTSFFF